MKWLMFCGSFVILLLISAPARAKAEVEQEDRIVNGSVVENLNQFPWVAMMVVPPYYANTNSLDRLQRVLRCGGSIINERFVLTAAHCFFFPEQKQPGQNYWQLRMVYNYTKDDIQIAVGRLSSDFRPDDPGLFSIRGFYKHPDYNVSTLANDVALIEMERNLPLNGNNIDSIPFAPFYAEEGQSATISGWGDNCDKGHPASSLLKYINVKVTNFDQCNEDLKRGKNTDIAICAQGWNQNIGVGDSGGGLFVRAPNGKGYLIGVVSMCLTCSDIKGPGWVGALYARVSQFQGWINSWAFSQKKKSNKSNY